MLNWQIGLERLRVIRHQERGSLFVKAGDEPYLVGVGFRSTFGRQGSTRTFTNRYHDDEWAENITAGRSRAIPRRMGIFRFDGVRVLTAAQLAAGQLPEVLGVVVIGMESDATAWSRVDVLASRLRTQVRREVVQLVEGAAGVAGLPVLAAAADRVRQALMPSVPQALAVWWESFGDVDDVISAHFVMLVAVNTPISFPMVSNTTLGTVRPRNFTVRFVGDGAQYEVDSAVRAAT